MNNDIAMLNALVGDLNNPANTGADSPIVTKPVMIPPPAAIPDSLPTLPVVGKRVFFTGSLAVGKDYVAEQVGAPIFGFADPIYAIATYLFGVEVTSTKNKDLPGMRTLLQQTGQWGRNDIDDKYPYTVERATFCLMIRSLGTAGVIDPEGKWKVDWKNFGLDPLIWTTSMLARVNEYFTKTASNRVSNTNVRFKHEYGALIENNWEHYHVMCSPQTWAQRLSSKKLTPESPQIRDKSEHMAAALNQNVTKLISREPRGKMLKVIWNDTNVAPPSPRILTLAQFCERVSISDNN